MTRWRYHMTIELFLLPLFSLLVGLKAKAIGAHLRVIDYPGDNHKTHSAPTPLVGGLAVIFPLLIACAHALWMSSDSAVYGALLIVTGGAFLLGFFDDRKGLSPSVRLFIAAALVLTCLQIVPDFVVQQFSFSFLSEPIPLTFFSLMFSVLVIVGMMNAFNMADGMNGLGPGLSLMWCVFLLFYAPPEILPIIAIFAVCILVTLIFNLRGMLFLGNSGAYALGVAISVLTIYVYNTTMGDLRADVVVVWFIVPVVDCLRLMFMRVRENRSPLSPDTNHLHHHLQRMLPKQYALLFYWMLVAIPGAIAIAVPSFTPVLVLLVASIYLGLFIGPPALETR